MVTYAELQSERWYNEETIPPNLARLRSNLLNHYRLSAGAIGIKGNNLHLRGAHRSRAWIQNSRFCTNRTYTVSRTVGDRTGGDSNWIAGIDIGGLPQSELIAMCKRVDVAVRAGRLEKLTEWYGNFDGDTRVDGFDNIANRVATSDSSHLTHFHGTLDRGHANDDHTDLFNILVGKEADMTPQDLMSTNLAEAPKETMVNGDVVPSDGVTVRSFYTYFIYLCRNAYIARKLSEALYKRPTVDSAAVATALAADVSFVDAIATAVAAKLSTDTLPDKVIDRMKERL